MRQTVTVNPTGDNGSWGQEKAKRLETRLIEACDRQLAQRRERKERRSRRKAPGCPPENGTT